MKGEGAGQVSDSGAPHPSRHAAPATQVRSGAGSRPGKAAPAHLNFPANAFAVIGRSPDPGAASRAACSTSRSSDAGRRGFARKRRTRRDWRSSIQAAASTPHPDPAFSHAGVVILASAGDTCVAEGSTQPCSFASVVCAGGTSLRPASNARGYVEVVWNDLASGYGATGSGCSSKVAKPSWQTDTGCKKRSQSHDSFDADPEYGVAVYDTTPYEGYSGWLELGGTSVASPALAGVYALAGNASSLGPTAAQAIWGDAGAGLWRAIRM